METVATFRRGDESARVVVYTPSGMAQAVQQGEWCSFGEVADAVEYLEGLGFVRESVEESGPSDAAYRDAARSLYGTEDVNVDDDAVISRGDDEGAWVAAWVWVPDSSV